MHGQARPRVAGIGDGGAAQTVGRGAGQERDADAEHSALARQIGELKKEALAVELTHNQMHVLLLPTCVIESVLPSSGDSQKPSRLCHAVQADKLRGARKHS